MILYEQHYCLVLLKTMMFHIVFNLVLISQNIQYFMKLNFMKQKWKVEIAYLFLLNGMHVLS